MHRSLIVFLAATVASGCGGKMTNADQPDLATGTGGNIGPDAAVPLDLAVPSEKDLAMAVMSDLAMPPDPVKRSYKFETSGPIALAIGDDGGPVIAGGLINSSRFGDITLAATAEPGKPVTAADLFVVRFGGAGTSAWGKRFGDVVDQLGSAVAVNADKVVLVAGLYSGDLQFRNDLTLTSPAETNFVAALDGATGAVLWARTLDLGPGGFVLGLAADAGDHGFVIAATATAAANFGTFTGTAGGGKDIFVAKVAGDAGGTLAWARQIGGAGDQTARAVAVDGAGRAVVVGQFGGALDFGDGALPPPATGAKNLFVAELAGSNGAAVKSIAVGAKGTQLAQAVAVDGSGDVVIAGYLAGPTVTFPGGAALVPHGKDGFVAKLAGDLASTRWARRIGDIDNSASDGGTPQGVDPQEATGVAIDGAGHVAVVGVFAGTTDFGIGAPATAIGSDAFAVQLDGASGQPRWVRTTRGSVDEKAVAVACSKSDNSVWVAGTFTASTTAAPIPNWGTSPMNELVFPMDDGSQPHTFLVQLAP